MLTACTSDALEALDSSVRRIDYRDLWNAAATLFSFHPRKKKDGRKNLI